MAMPNLELSRDLIELLRCFLSREVRFLIIGGHAVSFHGYPRFTKDLDIWVERAESNAIRIVEALKDFGFDFEGLSPEMFMQESRMTQMGREPNRVDILHTIKGVEFEPCFSRAVSARIADLNVPFISKQDLILNKIATARPQDVADAHKLE